MIPQPRFTGGLRRDSRLWTDRKPDDSPPLLFQTPYLANRLPTAAPLPPRQDRRRRGLMLKRPESSSSRAGTKIKLTGASPRLAVLTGAGVAARRRPSSSRSSSARSDVAGFRVAGQPRRCGPSAQDPPPIEQVS